MTINDFRDKLVEVFKQIEKHNQQTNKNPNDENVIWTPKTENIKMFLAKLAENMNLFCRYTAKDESEWLWDFVMYESHTGEADDIGRLWLVIESENNTNADEIKIDMQKLLVARAKLRCYVFPHGSKENVTKTFKKIKDLIRNNPNTQKDDSFLIAGWNNEDYTYLYDDFTGGDLT